MYQVELSRTDAAAGPLAAASFFGRHQAGTVLFDHQTGGPKGQSLLMSSPRALLIEQNGEFFEQPRHRRVDCPVRWMREQHRAVEADTELAFVGGLAGYLGFEFGWRLDQLRVAAQRSNTPRCWVGRYDAAAVYDHHRTRWTVAGCQREAVDELVGGLQMAQPVDFRGEGRRNIDRDVDAERYQQGVQQAVEAIYAGELFEVNYTERFHGQWQGDRWALYEGLRSQAPGDWGGVVDGDEVFVASVSPEQFLAVGTNGEVVTRPIKGTRPRGETAQEDRRLAEQLVTSEKDRAENVMIVDLMRNDLTRVCRAGSVEATELCALESFESVHHLVSTVRGRLAEDFDALDAFVASFPAGSITGAPKLRSMEWVAEHEQSARGPYTGSMFYWSDHGQFDSNVLIRTAVLCGDELEYGAGGAVVADSDPDGEFEEACWKARPFLELLEAR